jgi:hypothetical protein
MSRIVKASEDRTNLVRKVVMEGLEMRVEVARPRRRRWRRWGSRTLVGRWWSR